MSAAPLSPRQAMAHTAQTIDNHLATQPEHVTPLYEHLGALESHIDAIQESYRYDQAEKRKWHAFYYNQVVAMYTTLQKVFKVTDPEVVGADVFSLHEQCRLLTEQVAHVQTQKDYDAIHAKIQSKSPLYNRVVAEDERHGRSSFVHMLATQVYAIPLSQIEEALKSVEKCRTLAHKHAELYLKRMQMQEQMERNHRALERACGDLDAHSPFYPECAALLNGATISLKSLTIDCEEGKEEVREVESDDNEGIRLETIDEATTVSDGEEDEGVEVVCE